MGIWDFNLPVKMCRLIFFISLISPLTTLINLSFFIGRLEKAYVNRRSLKDVTGFWSVYQLVNTVTKLGFNIKYHQCHSIISKMAPHANNGTCPWSLLFKRKTKISDPIHLLFKAKNMHRQSNKMPVFIECLHQIVFVKWRIKQK